MICMKKVTRFSSCPRAKVRRQGPPGSARAQPWYLVTNLYQNLKKNVEGISPLTDSYFLLKPALLKINSLVEQSNLAEVVHY